MRPQSATTSRLSPLGLESRIVVFGLELGTGQETPAVLVTVLATAGPAYSKQGTRVVVDAHGAFSDMLGGGCLDADITEHALAVLATGQARVVEYDLRHDTEVAWGLGTGCLGSLKLLLEALPAEPPAAHVWSCLQAVAEDGCKRWTALEIRTVEAPTARTWHTVEVQYHDTSVLGTAAPEHIHTALARLTPQHAHHYVQSEPNRAWFLSLIQPAPRLVIVGAGRDVEPLYALVRTLAWSVSVYDPRAVERQQRFPEAHCGPALSPSDMASIEGDTRAVIVMTHNLERDSAALAVLAHSKIPFIGLLGPASRRDRILTAMGSTANLLAGRLFAPVGLAVGAQTPAEIALSIVAQVLSHLRDANGGPLSQQSALRATHGS